MDPVESMWRTYETVADWVKFADAKAATLLGAEGVLVGFIASRDARGIFLSWVYIALSLAFSIIALLTAYFCARCIAPQLSVCEPASVTFFCHIAAYDDAASYTEKSREVWSEEQEASKEICRQIWANSRVANEKYHWVRCSIWSFLASLILAVVIAFV